MADVTRTTRRGQSHQVRGQGQGGGHGHGHPNGGRPSTLRKQKQQKQQQPLQQKQQQQQRGHPPAKKPSVGAGEPTTTREQEEEEKVIVNGHHPRGDQPDGDDGGLAVKENGREERVMITQDTEMDRRGRGVGDGDDGGRGESPAGDGGGTGRLGREFGQGDWNNNAGVDGDSPPATPPPPLPSGGPRLSQEKYDVTSFNSSLDEFVGVLSDPRYQEMRSDYPVDDLMSVVSSVSASIEEYKEHSMYTQHQLHSLQKAMKTVKENLHLSITRQSFDLTAEEAQTIEELELQARLTEVNAAVARSHNTVAKASRLNVETEQTALQASIAAQQAKHEAERIEEEIRLKAELERKKAEEEARRLQEEQRKREEEEKKEQEEEEAKKLAKSKSMELKQGIQSNVMEHWAPLVYSADDGTETGDLRCIIRGHPATFNQTDVTCNVVSQGDVVLEYQNQEELISKIVAIKPTDPSKEGPVEPIYVAIPYVARLPVSREPVVKGLANGVWEEIISQEVSLDGFKEYRFVQAKMKHFTTLLVLSRFKQDYLTVERPRRLAKLSSSYDPRIAVTIPKGTFETKVDLIMQVQPVDTSTVNEFRSAASDNKNLLASSPILITKWETQQFMHPITMTVPCPPNPTIAKKMANLKKQKEEKLKAPKVAMTAAEETKPKKPAQSKQAKSDDDPSNSTSREPATKWYMGQYGQTEDDENDKLCLMAFLAGKWTYMSQVAVTPTKLDLVSFSLENAYDRMVIFRTRVDVTDDQLRNLVKGLSQQLTQRCVKVITKQRADDPYAVCCNVVLSSAVEKTETKMRAEGYTEGLEKHPSASIKEGESIVLQLHGNLKFLDSEEQELKVFFNSNLPATASFVVLEVDRYLQRNYNVFRGALRVMRRYEVAPSVRSRKVTDEDFNPIQHDILCDIDLEIPKFHLEPDPIPKRAAVVIHESGVVDKDYLHRLAAELGDDWRRLADKLHVSRIRQQAILRSAESQDQAKFDMLLTWLKRCPQASDKVSMLSSALASMGRKDLAIQIKFGMPFSPDPLSLDNTERHRSMSVSISVKERTQ